MLCVEHDAQEDAQSSVLGYRCILCTKSNDNNLVSMREGIKVDSSANDTRMIKSIWAVSKLPATRKAAGQMDLLTVPSQISRVTIAQT